MASVAARRGRGIQGEMDAQNPSEDEPDSHHLEDSQDCGTHHNYRSNTETCQHKQDAPQSQQTSSQSERSSSGFTIFIPYWLLATVIFVGSLLLLSSMVFMYMESLRPRFFVPPEIMQDLGLDGVIMFRQHDRDSDGVLDLVEFEPLAHRLLEINITHHYELSANASEEVVTLQAYLTPLVLSSMSKDLDSRPPGLDHLHGLKRWRAVAKHQQKVAARHFGSWLPPNTDMLDAVGDVYELVDVPEELHQGVPISSNRYVPPRLVDKTDILIHVLLSMFHPRPFVMSRFMPHGSVAVVRAYNSRAVDIVFRIHAEFQLNEPPFNPFWFTPAQFTGHLTIDKDLSHVHDFNLHVPNNKKLNVDMEWLTGQNGDQGMEVDIGFLPEMVINCTGPSVVQREEVNATDPDQGPETGISLKWTEEISMGEAVQKLELKMYPFKKVTYHNMTEAFNLAQQQDKLVHHILLWGALDDQSC